MPFANFKDTETSTFTRPVYFQFTPGQHIIRVLDEEAFTSFCYWLGSGYVLSPDEDDPIRNNNKRIRLENPDTYKDIKGYRTPQQRGWVNVLDKTVAKSCPECDFDVKSMDGQFPMLCPKCGTNVSKLEPQPLNKVRILSGGRTLFDQFNALEKSFLNDSGDPIGLTSFDIILNVQGTGRNRKIFAIPSQNKDEVNLDDYELFDLSKSAIKLTTEEMEQIVRGVSLKDIFAARRAESETSDVLSDEEESEIADKVASVFS